MGADLVVARARVPPVATIDSRRAAVSEPHEQGDSENRPQEVPPSEPSGWGTGPVQPIGYRPAAATPAGHYPAQPGQPPYGQPQYGQPQYGQPQYGQPQYGQPQYGQPQYGQPQYGQPQYGQPQYGQPAGYAPPAQRGIIPLRPLSLGEIFDGAFRSIRANPRVMFGFSAVVVTISVILTSIIQWYSFGWMGDLMSAPLSQQDDVFAATDVTSMALGYVALIAISLASTTVLTGVLILSVSRSVIGESATVGEIWQQARQQIWRLLGLTLLVMLLIAVVPALWAGAIVGAAAAQEMGLLLAVFFIGGIGVVVWAAWISIRTLLSTPALMLERLGVIAGLTRGWRLSRGTFWRLLGIYLLTTVIVATVAGIIVGPVSIVATLVTQNPFGPVGLAITGVGSILGSVLTTPFTAAVVALLYIDTRMRNEGLDVELARAAEAASGSAGQARG